MAEKEHKDIPVKEQDDGSALVKVEPHEQDEFEKELNKDAQDKNNEDHEDSDNEDHEDGESAEDHGDSDDEREKIREARREERRLKKELAKQREVSAKHKISSLEKRNQELADRLARLESGAASLRLSQIDKHVEYAKMKMLQAAQSGDAAAQVEYLEQLTDAKQRLAQMQHYKQQQLEAARKQPQNVPTPMAAEVQENANSWLKKNSWYDPQARDTDSRIAKVVDQELAAEGWDPSDSEYWSELDNRLSARLPHRYTKSGGANTSRRAGPTASSRVSNESSAKPNTITLSRERVQAIKDAGAWDNVEKRNKMIRAYASYDRNNKG